MIRQLIFNPLLAWLATSAGIGTICLLLWWFTPSWLPTKLRGTLFAVGVGALTVGGFYWYAFRAGEAHMTQRLAAQDRAAWERVERGAKEVDACNGGVDWDVVTGQCEPGSGTNAE